MFCRVATRIVKVKAGAPSTSARTGTDTSAKTEGPVTVHPGSGWAPAWDYWYTVNAVTLSGPAYAPDGTAASSHGRAESKAAWAAARTMTTRPA